MNKDILFNIFIPFLGTALGSGLVLFMKRDLIFYLEDFFTAVAGGIMTAASVWSLIIPCVEESAHLGRYAFLPALAGITVGVIFMIYLSRAADRVFCAINKKGLKNTSSFLAVTIHNIPEGMAVGCVCVSALESGNESLYAAALALSLGIAVQNIPEGAVISLPMYAGGVGKLKAFIAGALSGIVEPIGAALALVMAEIIGSLLPYFLAFAAGTMLYVVTEEMMPLIKYNGRVPLRGIAFVLGFVIMMSLDVALS